jgi:hypothetical protein
MAKNPLPKSGSGYYYNVNELNKQYGLGRIRRGREYAKYLLDAGFTENGLPTATSANPFSQRANIERSSMNDSFNRGFGFTGRQAELAAAPQIDALNKQKQDTTEQYWDQEQDADLALRQGTSQAARDSAMFGVENSLFSNPTVKQIRRYRGRTII